MKVHKTRNEDYKSLDDQSSLKSFDLNPEFSMLNYQSLKSSRSSSISPQKKPKQKSS